MKLNMSISNNHKNNKEKGTIPPEIISNDFGRFGIN